MRIRPRQQEKPAEDGRREHVGRHQALETDAAGQHGDDLAVLRKFRGEEDGRDEHEQRAEAVDDPGNEAGVVIEHDLVDRHAFLHELVDLLAQVEDDHDRDGDKDREQEGSEELPDDVAVQDLDVRLLHYNLVSSLRTMASFQAPKSPAAMCSRACPTRFR